jgi:hypothetical protein
MAPIAYAWRVIREDGSPTSIVVTLADDADARVVSLVRSAAERSGVLLEPIQLDQLVSVDALADAS